MITPGEKGRWRQRPTMPAGWMNGSLDGLLNRSPFVGLPICRARTAGRRCLGGECSLRARELEIGPGAKGVIHLTNVARRDLEMAAETPREVRDVLEADFIGNFGDGAMAFWVRHQNFI